MRSVKRRRITGGKVGVSTLLLHGTVSTLRRASPHCRGLPFVWSPPSRSCIDNAVQHPPLLMTPPAVSEDARSSGERMTFTASDGEPLQYKQWTPPEGFSRAMILLHRGHEHADRWDPVVPQLA